MLRVGITDYAQDALGDIVFVTLPEVGRRSTAGEPCGEVESTKSVSDLYAPVSGAVVARNEALDATPELVNTDPYGEGWLFELRPADAGRRRRAAGRRRPTGTSSAEPAGADRPHGGTERLTVAPGPGSGVRPRTRV